MNGSFGCCCSSPGIGCRSSSRGIAVDLDHSSGEVLCGEIGETIGRHHLRNTHANRIEWLLLRLRRELVCKVGVRDSGINKWENATKDLSSGEGWVATDIWDADDERIEVLLSSNETDGGCYGICTGAELGNDFICFLELEIVSW